ncbi:hypothetical protein [uncultured Tenacibaculum sp.]|uniref:hypothetical protein n=1 Tax=uncultured Tenacibaculum sp. TaxID=174713 RepID=UPI00261688C9|nr:hypothetical protein [uncultured Tenacibaculum sp.]
MKISNKIIITCLVFLSFTYFSFGQLKSTKDVVELIENTTWSTHKLFPTIGNEFLLTPVDLDKKPSYFDGFEFILTFLKKNKTISCYENLGRCGNEPGDELPTFPTIIKYNVVSKNKIKIDTKDVSEFKQENNRYVPTKFIKKTYFFKISKEKNKLVFKKEI